MSHFDSAMRFALSLILTAVGVASLLVVFIKAFSLPVLFVPYAGALALYLAHLIYKDPS